MLLSSSRGMDLRALHFNLKGKLILGQNFNCMDFFEKLL